MRKYNEKIDKELTINGYDEIEYWLANVEVLDNTDYILNNRKAKILVRYLKEKQQEIERLNNIINKLEAHCDIELNRLARETSHIYEDSLGKTKLVNEDIYNEIGKIKYILQELKGEDKK